MVWSRKHIKFAMTAFLIDFTHSKSSVYKSFNIYEQQLCIRYVNKMLNQPREIVTAGPHGKKCFNVWIYDEKTLESINKITLYKFLINIWI